jgi:hypothetical protein
MAMMTLLSAFVLTLGASAAPAAAAPVDLLAPQDIANVLCLPAAAPVEMARGGGSDPEIGAQAYCVATCTQSPNVSCSGNSCSAVNQNCASCVQGYVQCDGVYQYCGECAGCGGSCTFFQCRQSCSCPGGISVCDNPETCECHCEWM